MIIARNLWWCGGRIGFLNARSHIQFCKIDRMAFVLVACSTAKATNLQMDLMGLDLKNQKEIGKLTQESTSWQKKAEDTEKEKNECLLDKLQLQTREQKHQELKSAVLQELEPVLKNLKASAEQFLTSYEMRGCYRLEIENTFRSVFRNLQTHLDTVAQELDRKASEVTRENALLQREKAACKQQLQERDQQLSRQQQQFDLEKQILQATEERQAQKIRGECTKTLDENESLKLQLERTKQACISLRVKLPRPQLLFLMGRANPLASTLDQISAALRF